MIKLFASDLDGTLLNEYHEVDDIICKAIEMVEDHHAMFSVATGRHIFQYQRLDYDIKSDYYIISMNGALILDNHSDIVSYQCLDKQFIKELLVNFGDYHFDFLTPYHKYVKQSKEEYHDILKNGRIFRNKKRHFDYEKIAKWCIFNASDEDILKQDIIKIDIIIEDDNCYKKFNDFINQFDNICNAPSHIGAFEITAKGVNKGSAIKTLCQKLNIDEDEVAVYGDGGNDIEMLKMFKHAYAPADAIEDAKKYALEVLGDYSNHSVALHIIKTLNNRG